MNYKSFYIGLISILLSGLSIFNCYAQIPQEVSYQGYITDSSGKGINGTVPVQFSLYNVEEGGTPIWTESQDITINNGIFTVRLGQENPLNIEFDQPIYLGIKLAPDNEMMPRRPLTSVPFALNADKLDGKDASEIISSTIIHACNCENDASHIQQAIDSLPVAGGTIHIKAGNYNLTNGVHINRSNVTIMGEQGTFLKLGNKVQRPVLLVGTDKETPTTEDTIQNIRITNVEIDGNKANQESETDPSRTWIRNNAIDVRAVDNLWIEDMNIHDARSGGVVVSWNSHRIFITNSFFYSNQLDGIALYDSEDIEVSNCLSYSNEAAGISIDNNLHHASFHGGAIKKNGDVGIFIRDSRDLNFHDLTIYENDSYGIYLSHHEPGTDTGVSGLLFQGISVKKNGNKGLWLDSTSTDSPNNVIIGSVFLNNTGGCIQDDTGGALIQESIVCQNP